MREIWLDHEDRLYKTKDRDGTVRLAEKSDADEVWGRPDTMYLPKGSAAFGCPPERPVERKPFPTVPREKLEWKVRLGAENEPGLFVRVELYENDLRWRCLSINRRSFSSGGWSERCTRKMERKIEKAKESLMRAYLLCKRQSGKASAI